MRFQKGDIIVAHSFEEEFVWRFTFGRYVWPWVTYDGSVADCIVYDLDEMCYYRDQPVAAESHMFQPEGGFVISEITRGVQGLYGRCMLIETIQEFGHW